MSGLLEAAVRSRLTVGLGFAFAAVWGVFSLSRVPIDAVPDITNLQVAVNTRTGALDPEQIERTVTYPIEIAMTGIAGVKDVRSLSKYGLSQVVVIFEDGTDLLWMRQQVAERLQGVREEIPDGLAPELAPITTGLGEVVMYAVRAREGSALASLPEKPRLMRLRTVQDFEIAPYLKRTVSNVSEVDSTGGYKRVVHVDLKPDRLERLGLSVEGVIERLESLGENFGGGYIQPGGRQVIVRSEGRIETLEDIRRLPVTLDVAGRSIPLSRVADVHEGYVQRVGGATLAGEEVVLGTVLMLSGANSRQVAVDSERALTSAPLPDDVEVEVLYSRSFLVGATLKTVLKNLGEGAALVVAVLLVILGNVRAAVLVATAIPLSMLIGGIGMRHLGVSANLMSLGAIDFGLLVDGSVVMVENVLRGLDRYGWPKDRKRRLSVVVESAREVARPVTLGLLIIMLAYVPILSLEGVEGKLYHPMAMVVLMALGASLLVALFLMPALAYVVLRAPKRRSGTAVPTTAERLRRAYRPVLEVSFRNRAAAVVPAVVLALAGAMAYRSLGADFMPALDEGDLVVNLTRPADIGVDASLEQQKASDRVIGGFEEVKRVFSRIGTPESATDPMGVHLSDTFVILEKEAREWPVQENGRRRTKRELYEALKAAIEKSAPGQEVGENQPIEMRFGEILEGSRADVTLRIFGKNLDVLVRLLEDAIRLVEPIPGVEEVEMDALTALRRSRVLNVKLRHEALARYGLEARDVNRLIGAAMGGREVGSFYEQQRRLPVVVRLEEGRREAPGALGRLPVRLPSGGSVPLGRLASLEEREEVTTIAHHGGQRYSAVAIFLAGRDVGGFMEEARRAIDEGLDLPEGYTVEWGGQFRNLARARGRLMVIVPATFAAVLFILWRAFGSVRQALLVALSVPLALTGGALALYLRGMPMTVSSSIGFIALMGIAVLNAMVMVTFFNQLRAGGTPLVEAARRGALIRLRPVLMTALVAGLGFVPMALNSGIGAEVQRPLATVVIGGLITATFLTLLVFPTLYVWTERRWGEGSRS